MKMGCIRGTPFFRNRIPFQETQTGSICSMQYYACCIVLFPKVNIRSSKRPPGEHARRSNHTLFNLMTVSVILDARKSPNDSTSCAIPVINQVATVPTTPLMA